MKFLIPIIAQCRTKKKKTDMHKNYRIVSLTAFKLTHFFAKIALFKNAISTLTMDKAVQELYFGTDRKASNKVP